MITKKMSIHPNVILPDRLTTVPSGMLISQYWYCHQQYRRYFWNIDASIGDTFHPQYRNGYRRYFCSYFWAIFDTNTFVITNTDSSESMVMFTCVSVNNQSTIYGIRCATCLTLVNMDKISVPDDFFKYIGPAEKDGNSLYECMKCATSSKLSCHDKSRQNLKKHIAVRIARCYFPSARTQN